MDYFSNSIKQQEIEIRNKKYMLPCIVLRRKSEDYVYGIWVYKVLGIWKRLLYSKKKY